MKHSRVSSGVTSFLILISVLVGARAETATAVERISTTPSNPHYVFNRAPLLANPLAKLPLGSVKAQGWTREYLRRQRDGLTGHLGEISVWLQKSGSAWLDPQGRGNYGWEELPYWLKGYGNLAALLDDPAMLAETQVWIEGVLASQRPDGDFGPDHRFEDDGTRDYWANMIMIFCLQSYYERSSDPRVLTLMTRYFQHQLQVPDEELLTHYWQKMRGGDNLFSVQWLYNRTGDAFLLELGEKLHRVTANWGHVNTLPNWHNVNIAQGFREPATFYLQSHDPGHLESTYRNFSLVRAVFGQVPGGMFGGDELCRPRYTDPHQAIETCGIVEQMLSDEILLSQTGDPMWADHCEDVAFNTYPAAVMPDFRALRYLTAPNMVVSDDQNHAPGIGNEGPYLMMNPFSSRCCQHNHSHGWPYFVENLWLATPDGGLCAAMYSPSEVTAKVGDGKIVTLTEDTRYPFEDTLNFTLRLGEATAFPLYLRVPRWCTGPEVTVNGKRIAIEGHLVGFLRLERTWADGDRLELRLPFPLSVRRWNRNQHSASVDYGPLTFSLQIAEVEEKVDSRRALQADSGWQKSADPSKWPSTILRPGSPWNYGLVVDIPLQPASFEIVRRPWPADDFPFTQGSTPILLKARAKRLPQWKLDQHGLAGRLPSSPALSKEPVENVTLIPMGAARLRISAFPVLAE